MKSKTTHKQVESFLDVLKDRYDLSDEDLKELADDLKFLNNYRRQVQRFTNIFFGSIITGLAVGTLWAIWEGVKSFTKH